MDAATKYFVMGFVCALIIPAMLIVCSITDKFRKSSSLGDYLGTGGNKQSARDTADRARAEIEELRAANKSARRDNKRAKELIAEAKNILGSK